MCVHQRSSKVSSCGAAHRAAQSARSTAERCLACSSRTSPAAQTFLPRRSMQDVKKKCRFGISVPLHRRRERYAAAGKEGCRRQSYAAAENTTLQQGTLPQGTLLQGTLRSRRERYAAAGNATLPPTLTRPFMTATAPRAACCCPHSAPARFAAGCRPRARGVRLTARRAPRG